VAASTAKVQWSYQSTQDIAKYHINVVFRARSGPSREVAFFETDRATCSLELPPGTLQRMAGPYAIEVIAEMGPPENRCFSGTGISDLFITPADDPGPVQNLRLAGEPSEHEIHVEWDSPADDGGRPIQDYEVALRGTLNAVSRDPANHMDRCWHTRELSHVISGLPVGAGPYRLELRARNAAGLTSRTVCLEVSTRIGKPAAPTWLRAQLLPGAQRHGCGDMDVVRLEFRAPAEDGGRSLYFFSVHAAAHGAGLEELEEEEEDAVPAEAIKASASKAPAEPGMRTRELSYFSADQCALQGPLVLGGPCACDVEVEPNCIYTFLVKASNGECNSDFSQPTSKVFVPSRVPPRPLAPPDVQAEQGGAAELRWESAAEGGGLPLTSFKIGILSCSALSLNGKESSRMVREVTVGLREAGHYEDEVIEEDDYTSCWNSHARYSAHVDGLEGDTRYRFVLAASNALGTGCWSEPSKLVSTPVAAPPPPANTVATVGVDSQGCTSVNVTWESSMPSGCGSVIAYYVALILEQDYEESPAAFGKQSLYQESPTALGKTQRKGPSCRLEVRERVAAVAGARMTWTSPLHVAGLYRVEVAAQNTMGQRSRPSVLALDVPREACPPKLELSVVSPHWAEESLINLGPVDADAVKDPFVTNVDGEKEKWLMAMLLWHDGGTHATGKEGDTRCVSQAPVDVVCFFRRRTGTTEPSIAVLGSSVTTSRLTLPLPAGVPMCLRLVARPDAPGFDQQAPPQSEPLPLLLAEDGHQILSSWEIWARQSTAGHPPRWTALTRALSTLLEAAWLEGKTKVNFSLPCESSEGLAGETCEGLVPGTYEMTFGDERRVQHSVRRLGAIGSQAKARRLLIDIAPEEELAASNLAKTPEDQCVICMEQRRTHAFMHADTGDGHLAVCSACAGTFAAERAAGSAASAFSTCPMCRRPFSSVQRIYQ